MADEEQLGGDEEPFLLDLVDAVLEGRPLDWTVAETIASDSQRALIGHLRSVAANASFNLPSPAVEAAPVAAPLQATWAPLDLLESIGRGAFATVYRAWDPQLHREVALKLLPGGQDDEESSLAEGRLLARVHHPNVVAIYGADRADGFVGLWMELVRGQTLEDIVSREGPLAPDRVITISTQLCNALSAVHRAGLVHRDVKAHNVIIDADGRLVLMDFGSSRSLDQLATSDIAGTPLYLPPETFNGGRPTALGDQYGVAVLLFHLLTGRYPVEGRNLKDVRAAHARNAVERDVRSLRADLPRRLAAAIARALAEAPSTRFESVDAMARALGPAVPTANRSLFRWASVGIAIAATIAVTVTTRGRQLLKQTSGSAPSGITQFSAALSTPSTRRLEPKGRWGPGSLSRSGRYFAVVAADGPAVFDMATGETRALPRPDADGYAEFAIASPDGQLIAYQWRPGGQGPYEIHVADRVRRSDRTIFRDDSVDFPSLCDWSHDGTSILVKLASEDGRLRIALIDVNTGDERIVHEITQGDPSVLSLSVDGRYVAYDLPDDAPPQHQSIRIVDTANGGEHVLLPGEQSNNRFPLWAGDGRSLFFLSDRSGTPDGWIVPVLEGNAIGEPQIAARNLGAVSLLGLTDTGTVYYDFQTGQFDIYEAELDPQTMTLSGQPHVIRSRRQGSNIGPSYSHADRRLAYISQRTALGGNLAARVIVVRDLTTGAERDLAAPLALGVMSPIWSPDDRRLLVRGTNRHNRWGEFIVDATTGAIQNEVVWSETVRNEGRRSIWKHDGTAILFSDKARGVVEHPLDGGPERVVFSKDRMPSGPGMNMFAYTRDSNRLAFTSWNDQIALDVVDPNGAVRELVRAEPMRTLNFQAWFPGDDYLLYSTSGPGRRGPDELWRVAVSGGAPQRVGLPINALTSVNTVALNPSGSAVAYTSGFVQYQLWVMEHFLPR